MKTTVESGSNPNPIELTLTLVPIVFGMEQVQLNAEMSSGQSGVAVLNSACVGTTMVQITTTGGTDMGSQPAHIHIGTCGSNGNILTVLGIVQNGTSTMKVPYPLSSLTGGKYYINIHNSANLGTIQSCGNIP
jgi:hypothetical protein